jgi:histidyl-tRNA synthetase
MRYDHSPLHTATFYGFLPRGEFKDDKKANEKKDSKKAESLRGAIENNCKGIGFDDIVEDKVTLIRQYLDKRFVTLPQPVMVYDVKPHGRLSLDVLGTNKSIGEAMAIETAYAILSDEYKEGELLLEINSIGDRDSIARFTRELQNYYKKNWDQIPKESKNKLKKDIFSALEEKSKEMKVLQENSPQSIGSLSETSRKHFKEVLEYIETLKIPYIINHNLIGAPSWMSETITRISLINDKGTCIKSLACGGRYNSLARKAYAKKDIPSFGIDMHLKAPLKEGSKINYKIFFIQLSFEAKLKSLQIMEMLRKANIPVYQSLSKDKLTSQIGQAEKMKVPYVLLMGKKEALEESIVVRDTTTRSQETILIKDLVPYLKKML